MQGTTANGHLRESRTICGPLPTKRPVRSNEFPINSKNSPPIFPSAVTRRRFLDPPLTIDFVARKHRSPTSRFIPRLALSLNKSDSKYLQHVALDNALALSLSSSYQARIKKDAFIYYEGVHFILRRCTKVHSKLDGLITCSGSSYRTQFRLKSGKFEEYVGTIWNNNPFNSEF